MTAGAQIGEDTCYNCNHLAGYHDKGTGVCNQPDCDCGYFDSKRKMDAYHDSVDHAERTQSATIAKTVAPDGGWYENYTIHVLANPAPWAGFKGFDPTALCGDTAKKSRFHPYWNLERIMKQEMSIDWAQYLCAECKARAASHEDEDLL